MDMFDAGYCPYCDKHLDGVSAVSHPGSMPSEGDATVCLGCGNFLLFDANGKVQQVPEGTELDPEVVEQLTKMVRSFQAFKSKNLSNTERQPMPAIMVEACDLVAHQYTEEFLKLDLDAPAALHLLLIDSNDEVAESAVQNIGFLQNTESGKQILAELMNTVEFSPASPFNAFVYVSEAWTVTLARKEGESKYDFQQRLKNRVMPSESPDRQEVLIVTGRYGGRKQILRTYDIDRINKKLVLREPPEDAVAHGRFVDGRNPEDILDEASQTRH